MKNRLLAIFGSPAHLAWTPPKIENAINGLLICKILGQHQKSGQNSYLGSILVSLLFVGRKFDESGPFVCLFIIIFRTTWVIFCSTCLLSRTVVKFVKIYLKRLGIVGILTVIFLAKSECPDKMRPRAGHISGSPPKPISCKTRHDFHSVEKKVCPKIRRLSTVIVIDKVGLQFIFPQKRSRKSCLL